MKKHTGQDVKAGTPGAMPQTRPSEGVTGPTPGSRGAMDSNPYIVGGPAWRRRIPRQ